MPPPVVTMRVSGGTGTGTGAGECPPPLFAPFFTGGGAERRGCQKGKRGKRENKEGKKEKNGAPTYKEEETKTRFCASAYNREKKNLDLAAPHTKKKNIDFAPPPAKKKNKT